jgi:hypothetical protein
MEHTLTDGIIKYLTGRKVLESVDNLNDKDILIYIKDKVYKNTDGNNALYQLYDDIFTNYYNLIDPTIYIYNYSHTVTKKGSYYTISNRKVKETQITGDDSKLFLQILRMREYFRKFKELKDTLKDNDPIKKNINDNISAISNDIENHTTINFFNKYLSIEGFNDISLITLYLLQLLNFYILGGKTILQGYVIYYQIMDAISYLLKGLYINSTQGSYVPIDIHYLNSINDWIEPNYKLLINLLTTDELIDINKIPSKIKKLIDSQLIPNNHKIKTDKYTDIFITSDLHADYYKLVYNLVVGGFIMLPDDITLEDINTANYKSIYDHKIITESKWIKHNTLFIIIGDLINGRIINDTNKTIGLVSDNKGSYELLIHSLIYNLRIKARLFNSEILFTIGEHDLNSVIMSDNSDFNKYSTKSTLDYFNIYSVNRNELLQQFYKLSPYLFLELEDGGSNKIICVHGGLHNNNGTQISLGGMERLQISLNSGSFKELSTNSLTKKGTTDGPLWSTFYAMNDKSCSVKDLTKTFVIVGHTPTNNTKFVNIQSILNNNERLYDTCDGKDGLNGCVVIDDKCLDDEGLPLLAFVDTAQSEAFRQLKIDSWSKSIMSQSRENANRKVEFLHLKTSKYTTGRRYNSISLYEISDILRDHLIYQIPQIEDFLLNHADLYNFQTLFGNKSNPISDKMESLHKSNLIQINHKINTDQYDHILIMSDIKSDYKTLIRDLFRHSLITLPEGITLESLNGDTIYDFRLITETDWNHSKILFIINANLIHVGEFPEGYDPQNSFVLLLYYFIYNLRIKAKLKNSEILYTIGEHDIYSLILTDFKNLNPFYSLSPYLFLELEDGGSNKIICISGGLHDRDGNQIFDVIEQLQNRINQQQDTNFLPLQDAQNNEEIRLKLNAALMSDFYANNNIDTVCSKIKELPHTFIIVGNTPTNDKQFANIQAIMNADESSYNKCKDKPEGNRKCVVVDHRCTDKDGLPILAFVNTSQSKIYGEYDSDIIVEYLYLHNSNPQNPHQRKYNNITRVPLIIV